MGNRDYKKETKKPKKNKKEKGIASIKHETISDHINEVEQEHIHKEDES